MPSGSAAWSVHAQVVLARLSCANLATTGIWRQAQAGGPNLALCRRNGSAPMPCPNGTRPRRPRRRTQRMGHDGAVNIREEGYEELKVGVVQDEPCGAVDHTKGGSWGSGACGEQQLCRNTSAAQRWSVNSSTEARVMAQDTEGIGDGAVVWDGLALASHQLVDQVQGSSDGSGQVAERRRHPGDGALAMNSRENPLVPGPGRATPVVNSKSRRPPGEHAEALRREAGYWQNQHRMNYLEMREEEWPIGSGMVESAGKQFKARLAGPGMRWSAQAPYNLLPVRCAILSGRFDEIWAKAQNVTRIAPFRHTFQRHVTFAGTCRRPRARWRDPCLTPRSLRNAASDPHQPHCHSGGHAAPVRPLHMRLAPCFPASTPDPGRIRLRFPKVSSAR